MAFDAAIWAMAAIALRTLMALARASEQLPPSILNAIDAGPAKLAAYAIVPAALFWFCRSRFEKAVLGAFRILSIVFALFLAQLFLWDTAVRSDGLDSLSPQGNPSDARNSLYIFLFDEWDYEATFGDSRFSMAQMPHLAELLSHSTFYRNAFSPGVETTVSIPRFLFQPDERIRNYSYPDLRDLVKDNQLGALNLDSIFDFSSNHFKCVTGFYLPYRDLLGPKVDRFVPIYDDAARYSPGEIAQGLLGSQLAFLNKWGIRPPLRHFRPFDASGWTAVAQENQRRMRPMLESILSRLPSPSISFFHLFLPHPPTFVNRDWTPRPYESCFGRDAYWEGVYAIDALVGDIARILKARGEYDASLVVLLSDHALKEEYGRPFEEIDTGILIPEKHVPLIVKYPGQRRPGNSTDPVLLADLHPLFKDFLAHPGKVEAWTARGNAGGGIHAFYAPDPP
ncbi:MAG: sulfatase-like hydrolase/transferase [Kiritimatiellia bacterium]